MGIVDLIHALRKYQDTAEGYLIASIVLAVALGLREAVDPYIKIPYVMLFPAMVICSLVGGRRAGILAAILGGVVAWYFWLPPRRTFALLPPQLFAGCLCIGCGWQPRGLSVLQVEVVRLGLQ